MQTRERGNLIVQVLDEVGCKCFNDMPESDTIVFRRLGDEHILLEDGETLSKRLMALGVDFHGSRSMEQCFNFWEHVIVFDLVVMVEGGEDLLIEEKEVGGFLGIGLD